MDDTATPDETRARLRAAEDELARVRAQLEEAVESHGGHIDRELAEDFARRLEALNSEVWLLKGKLRTPSA